VNAGVITRDRLDTVWVSTFVSFSSSLRDVANASHRAFVNWPATSYSLTKQPVKTLTWNSTMVSRKKCWNSLLNTTSISLQALSSFFPPLSRDDRLLDQLTGCRFDLLLVSLSANWFLSNNPFSTNVNESTSKKNSNLLLIIVFLVHRVVTIINLAGRRLQRRNRRFQGKRTSTRLLLQVSISLLLTALTDSLNTPPPLVGSSDDLVCPVCRRLYAPIY